MSGAPSQVGIEGQAGVETERPLFWAKALSSVYGAVRVQTLGAKTIAGRAHVVELWRLKVCRIALGPHRTILTPSLARPGTHLLNKVHCQTGGVSVFEQDGRRIELGPGDCLAYNLTRPYVLTSAQGACYESVVMPNDLVRRQSVPVELLRARKIMSSDRDDAINLAHGLVRLVLADQPTLPQSSAASVADSMLNLFSTSFARGVIGEEGFSRAAMMRFRAKNYIKDHLRETNLGVSQIAAALGCSTRYLHRTFEEEGMSVSRYIWRTRLEHCHEDLQSPVSNMKSITDVAFSWGFSSASHFARLFRSTYGCAPSALRTRARV